MLSVKQAATLGPPMSILAAPKALGPVINLPRPNAISPLPEETNSFRRFTFFFCLACIFLRFSFLQEAIAAMTGLNTYLIYFFAPPRDSWSDIYRRAGTHLS